MRNLSSEFHQNQTSPIDRRQALLQRLGVVCKNVGYQQIVSTALTPSQMSGEDARMVLERLKLFAGVHHLNLQKICK